MSTGHGRAAAGSAAPCCRKPASPPPCCSRCHRRCSSAAAGLRRRPLLPPAAAASASSVRPPQPTPPPLPGHGTSPRLNRCGRHRLQPPPWGRPVAPPFPPRRAPIHRQISASRRQPWGGNSGPRPHPPCCSGPHPPHCSDRGRKTKAPRAGRAQGRPRPRRGKLAGEGGVAVAEQERGPTACSRPVERPWRPKLGWRWQSRRGARGELAAERPSMAARARAREHGGGGSQEREGW